MQRILHTPKEFLIKTWKIFQNEYLKNLKTYAVISFLPLVIYY